VSPGELNNNRGSGGESFEWVLREYFGGIPLRNKIPSQFKKC